MSLQKALAVAICFGLSSGFEIAQAKAGDDLIMPPDLRAPAPVLTPAPPQPAKPKKNPAPKSSAKKPDAKVKMPAVAEQSNATASAPKPEKPSKGKDDDRLSFGMKWNVDELSGNNPSPGSLSDVLDKNINNATVGAGAQVGVKYKF